MGLYLGAPTRTAGLSKDQKREHTPRRLHPQRAAAALACSQGAIGCCSARRRLRAKPPGHAGRALFERHAAAGLVSLDDRVYGEQLCAAHRPAQYSAPACADRAGRHTYLRLKLPESKKHTETIITLKPAVRVYEALLAHATKMGHAAPTDYLFYPEVINRKTAMMIMDVQFRRVLDAAGLRTGTRGQNRTLYSLRHTAITFRLLYGQGIDLLTLAKNARTSVEMIERFYASELNAEMNVGMLQSRRQRVG